MSGMMMLQTTYLIRNFRAGACSSSLQEVWVAYYGPHAFCDYLALLEENQGDLCGILST